MSGGRFCLFFFISLIFFVPNSLHAASLDGTSTLVYKSNLQIFQNGMDQFVRGFVRLDNGIAIGPRASAFMDTNISVSGPLDLGETGTLVLLNSLYTDGPITLTSSGNIKGKATVSGDAKTIFLGGDLTLASTTYARTLHITGDWASVGNSGDLVIDGCGHTLDIQDRAQIFVDTNMTLTLRNMTIRTGQKSLMVPPIRLAAQGSKLALDNVMFDLGADFQFKQGQIFVHDEVAVTGTSAFVYQSPMSSYVTSGATWSFEQGTTFSVAPATYTDLPYTAGTATSNNFIVLADASSALSLSGCSFKTTYTGLRLRIGTVLFDNKVAVDTQAGMDVTLSGTVPVGYFVGATTAVAPYRAVWSPDGRFIAVACNTTAVVQIFRFDGSGAPRLCYQVSTPANPCYLAWSPDGRFLAVPCYSANTLAIYRVTPNSSPVLVGSIVRSGTFFAAWSPDGRFLATANWTTGTTSLFRITGVGTPQFMGNITYGSSPAAVAWSPDGRYLALADRSGNTLALFRFNGVSVPSSTPTYTATAGFYNRWVSWTSDGRFLAVGNYNDATVSFFRFNGSGNPVSLGANAPAASATYAVEWSPDGRFLAVANLGARSVQFYRLNGLAAPTTSIATVSTGSGPYSMDWSPDGRFFVVACSGGNAIQVFRCNFYYTGQPAQSFSNGLVFGDSVKGSAYNVDVNVAGSARVEVNGKVSDDSA